MTNDMRAQANAECDAMLKFLADRMRDAIDALRKAESFDGTFTREMWNALPLTIRLAASGPMPAYHGPSIGELVRINGITIHETALPATAYETPLHDISYARQPETPKVEALRIKSQERRRNVMGPRRGRW